MRRSGGSGAGARGTGCPVRALPATGVTVTPNHTRRIIQMPLEHCRTRYTVTIGGGQRSSRVSVARARRSASHKRAARQGHYRSARNIPNRYIPAHWLRDGEGQSRNGSPHGLGTQRASPTAWRPVLDTKPRTAGIQKLCVHRACARGPQALLRVKRWKRDGICSVSAVRDIRLCRTQVESAQQPARAVGGLQAFVALRSCSMALGRDWRLVHACLKNILAAPAAALHTPATCNTLLQL